jgi:hypothetical protein
MSVSPFASVTVFISLPIGSLEAVIVALALLPVMILLLIVTSLDELSHAELTSVVDRSSNSPDQSHAILIVSPRAILTNGRSIT